MLGVSERTAFFENQPHPWGHQVPMLDLPADLRLRTDTLTKTSGLHLFSNLIQAPPGRTKRLDAS